MPGSGSLGLQCSAISFGQSFDARSQGSATARGLPNSGRARMLETRCEQAFGRVSRWRVPAPWPPTFPPCRASPSSSSGLWMAGTPAGDHDAREMRLARERSLRLRRDARPIFAGTGYEPAAQPGHGAWASPHERLPWGGVGRDDRKWNHPADSTRPAPGSDDAARVYPGGAL